MKVRKIPLRTCTVTKERVEKKDLIRIVRTPEGKIEIDLSGKVNGRGAYLKKDITVVDKAIKSKVLNKHLECEVPEDIFNELKEIINK